MRKGLAFLLVFAMLISMAPVRADAATANPYSGQTVMVNPITSLSGDFIMGADVSMLAEIEKNGGKYYDDNGREKDCLFILKEHGINWVRLRLWNDPTTDANGKAGNDVVIIDGNPAPEGTPAGAGNCDLETILPIIKRAKALNMKVLLDFHYSDFWADPGKQVKPKAWKDLSGEDLENALYDFTYDTIKRLAAENALPDMVQIGNEVTNGMLHPNGNNGTTEGMARFAALVQKGIDAVRDSDPNNSDPAKRIKIMIHLDRGGNNSIYRYVFDGLAANGVNDFEIIGLSYYPYWHGTLDDLKRNMDDITSRYGKAAVVAETAYAFTLDNADGTTNNFQTNQEQAGGYKASIQGQATFLRDLMNTVSQVSSGKGLGIFYWEPDWIPVEGAGWITGQGNGWENQAMFDFNGYALPSLDVFKLVSSGGYSVPARLISLVPAAVDTNNGIAPVLPSKVKGIYDDASVRDLNVSWDAIDPALYVQGGSFSVLGTVAGTDLKAVAVISVTEKQNYVVNPGFESGSLNPWTVTGDTAALKIQKNAGDAHSGTYSINYYLASPFNVTAKQTITGLENGYYRLSAYFDGGGDENSIQLFAEDFGGTKKTHDFETIGWGGSGNWVYAVVDMIQVTNNQCTVGFTVDGIAGSWGHMDDVALIKVDALGNPIQNTVYVNLEAPSETLSDNEPFSVGYGLGTGSLSVYQEEVTISYDDNLMEWTGATPADNDTVISDTVQENGRVIITLEHNEPITGTADVIDLSFRAKADDGMAYGSISATSRIITNAALSDYNMTTATSQRYIAINGTARMALSAPVSVVKGDSFIMTVQMTGAGSQIYAGDVTVSYDASAFELVSVSSAQDDVLLLETVTNTPGSVRLIAACISGETGSFDLFKLTFRTKTTYGYGQSAIMISKAEMGLEDASAFYPGLPEAKPIGLSAASSSSGSSGGWGSAVPQGTTLNLSNAAYNQASGTVSGTVDMASVQALLNNLESAVPGEDGAVSVVFNLPAVSGMTGAELTLPMEAIRLFAANEKLDAIVIETGMGSLSLDADVLGALLGSASEHGQNITFSIQRTIDLPESPDESSPVGDRPAYEISIQVGGREITQFGGAWLSANLPYGREVDEDSQALVAYFIDSVGGLHVMPLSIANSDGVAFRSDHLSLYAVGYNPVEFADISDSPEKQDIAFIAARHIVKGYNGKFSPNEAATRAEFAAMLANLLGIDLKDYTGKATGFRDVPKDAWFAPYMAWAEEAGLLVGSNGIVSPNSAITQEQAAVILLKFTDLLHYQLPKRIDLSAIRIQGPVSPWAKKAMEVVLQAGLMGQSGEGFSPMETMTRGQAAKVIAELIRSILK